MHITGTFEAQSAIEVWGAVTIDGYMSVHPFSSFLNNPLEEGEARRARADKINRKCKSLTAYGSITTVGDQSWYEVEGEETVWGAKLIERDDYQG